MDDHSKFFRNHQTIKEYDGEEGSSGSSSDGELGDGDSGQQAGALVEAKPKSASNHLLMVALLEHLCTLYAPEGKQSKQLFKVLCKQLAGMKIMNTLGSIDEFSSVRTQYRASFAKLVQAAMSTISQEKVPMGMEDRARLFYQPRFKKPLLFNISDMISFHTSRYRDEFDEMGQLGSGAYGSVYKVTHRLDKLEYAVKKVGFQDDSPELWFKALREVQYLATLSHKNIVRYHGAWMEYQHPFLPIAEGKSDVTDDGAIPAISYNPSSSRSVAVVPYNRESSVDSSIIFQEDSSSNVPSYLPPYDDSLTDDSIEPSSMGAEVGASEKFYGRSFVVLHIQMELCYQTLTEWLRKRNLKVDFRKDDKTAIDEKFSLHILREILEGVNFIHTHGFIHRDLKPKNIFIHECCDDDDDLHIRIGDFGLARKTNTTSGEQRDTPMTPNPGRTGLSEDMGDILLTEGVGTTIYAAPEQLQGGDYDEKCDMYSLGLVILELFQPFKTEMERVHSLTDARKGILPTEFSENWPEIAEITKRLLSCDPDERPSSRDLLDSTLFKSSEQLIKELRRVNQRQSTELEELRPLTNQVAELKEKLDTMDKSLFKKDELIFQQKIQIEELKKAMLEMKQNV